MKMEKCIECKAEIPYEKSLCDKCMAKLKKAYEEMMQHKLTFEITK